MKIKLLISAFAMSCVLVLLNGCSKVEDQSTAPLDKPATAAPADTNAPATTNTPPAP